MRAKYFKHTLFSLEGQILAKEDADTDKFKIDSNQLLQDAWLLIKKIKDHTCPLIEPTEQWAPSSLIEHFGDSMSI